jgi:hypothetical protein
MDVKVLLNNILLWEAREKKEKDPEKNFKQHFSVHLPSWEA